MQNSSTINEVNIIDNRNVNILCTLSDTSIGPIKKNPVIEMLTAEGCETFVDYIEWLGLSDDQNLVILSSIYHYYYDAEEMKNISTIINLKELNHVKEINSFLHSIFHITSPKSNFIGCFIDNENINLYELRKKVTPSQKMKILDAIENGILSRVPFLNRMFSMLDSKTNKFMSRANVTSLMNDHGFKVLDMTELNGMIYFCVQRKHFEGN